MSDGAFAGDRDRLYRKVGLRLLPLLFLGYVVAMLDRNNVGFAKLGFAPELGFGESVFGVGAGLFYVGYVLFEIPSNLLLTRIGVKATFTRIMALWFLTSLACAFMTQPWHYFLLRFLLGAAEAGYFPGVLVYLTLWAPRARRAGFTAICMSALPLSGMIGAPLAGIIMHHLDGALGLSGWRWLFIVEAVPAAVMAMLVWRLLLDGPASAPWLDARERGMIAADLAADAGGCPSRATRDRTLAAFTDPGFYLLGIQAFALMTTLNGLNLWGPTIIKQSGVGDILTVSLLTSLPQTAGTIALLAVGWLSDRNGERRFHAMLPLAVAGIAWLMLPLFLHQPAGAVALLMLVAAGVFGGSAPFWSLPGQYLSGRSAAAGIAMITTMGGLGGMITPMIVGWLTERTGSLAAGLYFYGGLMMVGTMALYLGTARLSRRG